MNGISSDVAETGPEREIETPTRQNFSSQSYLYHVTRIVTICRSSPIETKPSSLASFFFFSRSQKRHRGEDEPGSTRNKSPASRKRERTNNLRGPTPAFGETIGSSSVTSLVRTGESVIWRTKRKHLLGSSTCFVFLQKKGIDMVLDLGFPGNWQKVKVRKQA